MAITARVKDEHDRRAAFAANLISGDDCLMTAPSGRVVFTVGSSRPSDGFQ
jgi:hypothetical protein